jgi:hypothetical protein
MRKDLSAWGAGGCAVVGAGAATTTSQDLLFSYKFVDLLKRIYFSSVSCCLMLSSKLF